MRKTKVFAAYLPQFHETEDNNKFWGENFTDWVGVKRAEPQFTGHIQPVAPLNENYYDLSDVKNIEWQTNLANTYGIDGFNIYHYWFKEGKQELEKPAELLLTNKKINIEFFFTWDNCSWIRTWSNIQGNDWGTMNEDLGTIKRAVLVELDYGDEKQWKKHFDYLLDFFKDERYLKIDGKPVFAFMTSINYPIINEMIIYWKNLSVQAGFKGIYILSQKSFTYEKIHSDSVFMYQPIFAAWGLKKIVENKLKEKIKINISSIFPIKYIYDYDKVWRKIIKNAKLNIKYIIPGSFVRYDDTPRRGEKAHIIFGASPNKFETYFGELYKLCCTNDKEFMLITAWNEWGEGAFLEPDTNEQYLYLEAIRKVKESYYEI